MLNSGVYHSTHHLLNGPSLVQWNITRPLKHHSSNGVSFIKFFSSSGNINKILNFRIHGNELINCIELPISGVHFSFSKFMPGPFEMWKLGLIITTTCTKVMIFPNFSTIWFSSRSKNEKILSWGVFLKINFKFLSKNKLSLS